MKYKKQLKATKESREYTGKKVAGPFRPLQAVKSGLGTSQPCIGDFAIQSPGATWRPL
jgi:hypothetical protein